MPDTPRRKIIVRETGAGDPTFFLKFILQTTSKEKEVPALINFKIGNKENPNFSKKIIDVFPVDETIKLMCSYTGSLRHVNIPATVCISFLEADKKTILSETEIDYSNIKKIPVSTNSLSIEQKVCFHFLDGDGDDDKNEVFLTYKKHKKNEDKLFTRAYSISTDIANSWTLEQIDAQKDLFLIKNESGYLSIKKGGLILSTKRSDSSIWTCKEARIKRFGHEISIYSIRNHKKGTYLMSNSKTGSVYLMSSTSPIYPWYLHFNENS